jgi:predicted amidophosphoribosyltransferase
VIDLTLLDPPPAGLPDCDACPYLRTGTPAICFSCACGGEQPLAVPRCGLCGEPLVDGTCPNTVCGLDDPEFSRIFVVTERADPVWDAVCRYKYDEDRGWADLLGRLLAGFLEERREDLQGYDLITAGALYVGPRANRLWDHLRPVLDAADRYAPGWPFAPDLIHKSAPSGQFLGRGVDTRRAIAEHGLRTVLSVPQPERVAGKRIVVVDDVYSEGFSLREMARVLRGAGAAEVAGLVLARKKGG